MYLVHMVYFILVYLSKKAVLGVGVLPKLHTNVQTNSKPEPWGHFSGMFWKTSDIKQPLSVCKSTISLGVKYSVYVSHVNLIVSIAVIDINKKVICDLLISDGRTTTATQQLRNNLVKGYNTRPAFNPTRLCLGYPVIQ